MSWLPDYLRSTEGRWVIYGMMALAVLDLSVRLYPAAPANSSAADEGELILFERQEPSANFKSWVAERTDVKSAEMEKAAKALAQKEAIKAPAVDQKVFVDKQSGKLQQFRIGNLKYRLWGVFSVSKPKGDADDAFAVLRPDAGASRIITVGDEVGGYSVTSVEDRSVSFEANDGRMVELELFKRRG